MKLVRSSSLAWFTLLTACLFGTVATYGTFGPLSSHVAQLCDMWKTDPTANVSFLAMGIITEAGGESRFYLVTTRFEGITVPAANLYDPRDPINQAAPHKEENHHWPHINLNDIRMSAEVLDLKTSQASWPHGEAFPGNGKGAFLLAFKPEAGFHTGEKYLAFISGHSTELFLASLTNPEARMSKVPIGGHLQPPSRTVFSTDNKLTPQGDPTVLASLRFLKEEQTTTEDRILKRVNADTILFVPVHNEHPTHVKASLAIDGGFVLNGHLDTEALFFAYSNALRKVYVFYGKEEEPVEVSFNDFLLCPNEWLQKGLIAGGIAMPVFFLIFAFCYCSGAKKKKGDAPLPASRQLSSVSVGPSGGTSTAASTATRKSTFAASGNASMRTQTSASATVSSASAVSSVGKVKTRTSGKPRTPKKKSGTPNNKSFNSPGGLARSMESSPAGKRGVFKFKAVK